MIAACAFMEKHYAERISLDQICRYAGLSRSALLRAFAKARGVTPYRHLESVRAIRERLYEPEFAGVTAVDFSELAQGCRTYEAFIEKMGAVSEPELNYLGVALCGARKLVNRLTGSIPLLR